MRADVSVKTVTSYRQTLIIMLIETLSILSRFYNSYKSIPYKDPSKVLHAIFPFIALNGHQEYINLLPYLSFNERVDLIEKYPELENIPNEMWPTWAEWFVNELYN